jgi:hypothetical protein
VLIGSSTIKIAHFVSSVDKHGRHRQFWFLIGQFLSTFSPWTSCIRVGCRWVHLSVPILGSDCRAIFYRLVTSGIPSLGVPIVFKIFWLELL